VFEYLWTDPKFLHVWSEEHLDYIVEVIKLNERHELLQTVFNADIAKNIFLFKKESSRF
jgi:hypothetical protein